MKRKTKISHLIICLFLTFIFYGAEKKALIIGINDYQNLPFFSKEKKTEIEDLQGPVNDAHTMKNILLSLFGFREDNILMVLDKNATRDNIINNFKSWLINGTKEGDMVFFYYSGHGTQVPDQNFDEEDGLDEALCPYDVVPEGARNIDEAKIILDDEMGVMFRKLRGRDVIVIIDSCHSATMPTRGVGKMPLIYLEKTPGIRDKFLPIKITGAERGKKAFSRDIPTQKDIPEGQIFLYSSREDEKSFEMAYPDGFHGIFTFHIVDILKKKRNITYAQLHKEVKDIITRKEKIGLLFRQTPQIEPERGEIIERVAFALPLSQPSLTPAPSPSKPSAPQLPSEMKEENLLVRVDEIKGASIETIKLLKDGLKKATFLKLTNGSFFDRLIRGEIKEGKYHARILNRLGDAIFLPATDNIEELTKSLLKNLENAYIAKKLAHLTNPSPDFKIRIWVTDENRQDFKIGERVIFNFFSERDCYLILVNLDSQGNFDIIFPNKYYRNNFVKGGRTITIPDEKMRREFELQFFEPEGEEVVKAIATIEPLNIENLGVGDLETLYTEAGSISLSLSTRGAFLENVKEKLASRKFQWSEDTVVIRTHK